MQLKKILSITIALAMITTFFSVGSLPLTKAEENTTIAYQKVGDWEISGEANYLTVSDLGIKGNGQYLIEFGIEAESNKSGYAEFTFDWRSSSYATKSGIKSANRAAITAIMDTGKNDSVAVGPGALTTCARGDGVNQYDYSIVWDVAAKTFDVTLDYQTGAGSSGTIQKTLTATGAFDKTDVLQFANGGKVTKVKDLTVTVLFEEEETEAPTEAPTDVPTDAPTDAPTEAPTETPSEAPTEAPTEEAGIYTADNGWTLNGSEEQQNGSLAIKAGGNTPTVFTPTLTTGKKYSITFDVTGLTSGGSDGWAYPFRMKVSAGGADVDGALQYRMAGKWEAGNNTTTGTNGTMEVIFDTVTGEWETYALGNLAYSGTFANPSDFALKFYRWSSACQACISNVQVRETGESPTEAPTETPSAAPTKAPTEETGIYTADNGWTLNGSEEQQNGSLAIKASGSTPTVFRPTLEAGKKYSITYDVTGLTSGGSDGWAFPFRMMVSAGGVDKDGALAYRMAGIWEDNDKSRVAANGTNGTNEIIYDTATGEWETYALGEFAQSGTFANPSDFALKFYRWSSVCQAYISNVQVREVTDSTPDGAIYTAANGWKVGSDAAELEGGILKIGQNDSKFSPKLEEGQRYEISFDVDVPAETASGSWAKPMQISLYGGSTTLSDIISYYFSGAWMDANKAISYGADGDGTIKIIIDTESGEWAIHAPGETDVFLSGTLEDVSDFTIGFHCEPYISPKDYPVYISNVAVREIADVDHPPVLSEDSITIYAGEEVQSAKSASALTDTIKVEFAQRMKRADLTESNIYVTPKGSEEKVSGASYLYEGTTLTLSFENGLPAGQEYTLHIDPVRNSGNEYAEAFTMDISVEGGVWASLLGVTQRGTAVTTAGTLRVGNASIGLRYVNTEMTEANLYLVVAYYSNSKLMDVDYVKTGVSLRPNNFNYVINYSVKSTKNVCDEVQFMIWDGFQTPKPLSAPLTLN